MTTDLSTMRPFREAQRIEITVGQSEGDLQGKDDKVLQAAVDYVARLGGGTVRVMPGTYTMRNALHLRPGITLRGEGDKTVLKKGPCVTADVMREADWFEYGIRVADTTGFRPGGGIVAVTESAQLWPPVRRFTVTTIRDQVLFLDQRTEANFWMKDRAKVKTLHPILCALNVNDAHVEGIVLDGNRAENDNLNGNFGGGVFMQNCNGWTFRNVISRNYHGDGFSLQVCDDIHFDRCQSLNNVNSGFHPGSGSQRPIFANCIAKGNTHGLFWCWGVCDGVVEGCVFSENARTGMSFGHRDTDNLVRNCVFERNGEAGILFRPEAIEGRSGDRNRIENCLIRDNGGKAECGVDIQGQTSDIMFTRCRFENSPEGRQQIAIRIAPGAGRVTLTDNTFIGCPATVQDQRAMPVQQNAE